VVGDEQRAALAGHVLHALGLDPEPVPVVEVEQRLEGVEHALGATPVVELALGLRRGNEAAQVAQVRRRLVRRRVGRLRLRGQVEHTRVWVVAEQPALA
jgi:hypothetical protein